MKKQVTDVQELCLQAHISKYQDGFGPILTFIGELFIDADDDNSGTVDSREFRRCLNQPHIQAQAESLGLEISNIELLFHSLDADRSGVLTLDELCEGFVKLKLGMRGEEKAIAFIQQSFGHADKDHSGTLTRDEFDAYFMDQTILRKMDTLGVNLEDVGALFDYLDTNNSGKVTVEQVISGFLHVRDSRNGGTRVVNFLRKCFQQADTDNNGTLDKHELVTLFQKPDITTKLAKYSLEIPDWHALFDELDIDGSGDLSWQEISTGMSLFWAQHEIDEELQHGDKTTKRGLPSYCGTRSPNSQGNMPRKSQRRRRGAFIQTVKNSEVSLHENSSYSKYGPSVMTLNEIRQKATRFGGLSGPNDSQDSKDSWNLPPVIMESE